MPADDNLSAVADVLRDIVDCGDVELRPETGFDELPGWDSIKFIELIASTEEAFGFSMDLKQLDRIRTIGDLLLVIPA